MASSVNETGITWSAAASISLNSTSRFDSDAVTLNVEDWDASLQVSADNSGTPASGDVVDVYVLWTNGDILGDSGDDYDTAEHAEFLCRLDTFSTNTPGEDPARRTVPLSVSGKKAFKVSAVAAQGGTRAVTFRARLVTHRPQ
jgi:hypothetical protein